MAKLYQKYEVHKIQQREQTHLATKHEYNNKQPAS